MKTWSWRRVLIVCLFFFCFLGICDVICRIFIPNMWWHILAISVLWIALATGVYHLFITIFMPLANGIQLLQEKKEDSKILSQISIGDLEKILGTAAISLEVLKEEKKKLNDELNQANKEIKQEQKLSKENQERWEHEKKTIYQQCELQIKTEQEKWEKENQETKQRVESLENLFHQVLDNIEMGIFFIGYDGTIQPYYASYLQTIMGDIPFAGQDMMLFFSSVGQQSQKMELMKSWLKQVIGSSINSWRNTPPPMDIVSYKKQEQSTIQTKYLKFTFNPILEKGVVHQVMVSVQDITKEKALQKELSATRTQTRSNIEYAVEIMKLDGGLLRHFLEELANKMKLFEEKLLLLQQGTFNRFIIGELADSIEEIKNNAQLLKFRAIAMEADKIKTLLEIVRNGQGGLRLEQLVEIEERTKNFMELLEQYRNIGQKLVKDEPPTTIAVNEKSKPSRPPAENAMSQAKVKSLKQKYEYLLHSVVTASAYPAEMCRFMRQMKETIEQISNEPYQDHVQVFEFREIFDRVLDSLRPLLQTRKVTLEANHFSQRLLLSGDVLKITSLLSMFMTASVWRAEETSNLKVQSDVFFTETKEPDVVKLESSVTIRNTNASDLEKIQSWYQDVQHYCTECEGSLSYQKWGFSLQLPLIINKYFGSTFNIGLIGPWYEKLQSVLHEIETYFPFGLNVISNPGDYRDIACIMVEAEALDALIPHIHNKIKQFPNIPLIAVYSSLDEKIQENAIKHGVVELLTLPFNATDVKACIFSCLLPRLESVKRD